MSGEHKEVVSSTRPNLARRFGGYFLDRLMPAVPLAEMTPIEQAVAEENAVITQRQEAHYHANLFRADDSSPENIKRLYVIKELFEKELQDCDTIESRFKLFATPFYAPFVNTLDLGETTRPGSHEEIETLKEEYHVLLNELIEKGAVTSELPREKATRTMHFGSSANPAYKTGTRNRDLLSFVDGQRTLTIAKRMTFLMPTEVYEQYANPQHPVRPRSIARIEKLIDKQDGNIIPVRTLYYVTNKPLKKTDD